MDPIGSHDARDPSSTNFEDPISHTWTNGAVQVKGLKCPSFENVQSFSDPTILNDPKFCGSMGHRILDHQ
ncbi:MAG: hypothetical protein SynsKO_20860 [Synoicihabitans sp.]